eukprot:6202223-Pleurochrysis_carterae.AAC.5
MDCERERELRTSVPPQSGQAHARAACKSLSEGRAPWRSQARRREVSLAAGWRQQRQWQPGEHARHAVCSA